MLNKLYSRTSTGAVQTWRIEILSNKYRTHYGQIDGTIQTTEWTTCKGKNTGRSNATTDAEQAIKEAQAIWDKKKASGYFESVDDIDTELFTEPMLAKKYEDYKNKLKYPIFSQPKLDGIRCIVKSTGMWSRNGKPIVSAPHILKSLSKFFKKYPSAILDGELYSHDLHDNFNRIVQLTKRIKPTKEELKESADIIEYWVYDWISDKKYSERLEDIRVHIPDCAEIFAVPTDEIKDEIELDKLYQDYIQAGYEGQIIRLDGKYEFKRSSFLLKRKEWQDSEFIIKDIIEGEGNLTGMAGKITFDNHLGIECESSIKGTRDYIKYIFEHKADYIGKKATIKYFNLTPIEEKPRFPYVIKIDRDSYE